MTDTERVKSTFENLKRIDIVNRRERVEFKTAKGDSIQIEGLATSPLHGVFADEETLYLVGFEGTVHLPDKVALNYKRGVDDLQRELFDTYAPRIDYDRFLSDRQIVAELGRYEAVPLTDALEVTRRFTASTCSSLLASQKDLYGPPTLRRIERKNKSDSFRADGKFRFLPNVEAGNLNFVPFVAGARTREELIDKVTLFITREMSLYGVALRQLLGVITRLNMEQDADKIYRAVLDLQERMADTEPAISAYTGRVAKEVEEKLSEGIEELARKQIPYGHYMTWNFGRHAYPISNQYWIPLIAQTAGTEIEMGKDQESAPATEETTKGHLDARDAEDHKAVKQSAQQFFMCATATGAQIIQLESRRLARQRRLITEKRFKEWKKNEEQKQIHAYSNWGTRGQKRHVHVRFTRDRKKNGYVVHNIGYSDYENFHKELNEADSSGGSAGDSEGGWGPWLKSLFGF